MNVNLHSDVMMKKDLREVNHQIYLFVCHYLQQYVRKAHSFRCGMDSTKYKDNVYVDIENIHIL